MPGSARATPLRRVTRSQSRELDDPNYGKQSPSELARRHGLQARAHRKHLPPVIEQSPISSHQTPTTRVSSSVVPDTPAHEEGSTNISGTTFLAHDSGQDSDSTDSEDGGVDAIDMADELPDLQQASTRLLELVGTNSSDAKGIYEVAKRISNPAHVDNKRFKRVYKKLGDSMKVFTSESYIDAIGAARLLPLVTADAPEPWDPRPYLYRANCAWLALTTLSAAIGSQTQVQAIENLDRQFPAPFMSRMVPSKQKLTGGASCALKATFDLALEIRTQFLIAELERRQHEKGFDATSVLRGVFYQDPTLSSSNGPSGLGALRGFNLEGTFEDENHRLPDNLHEEVSVRIDELETSLFDDDDNLNLTGLKTIFNWRRFCLRVARFVQLREQEFKGIIASQPKLEDVRALVIKTIRRQADQNATKSPDHSTLVESNPEDTSNVLKERPVEESGNGGVEQEESAIEEPSLSESNHEQPASEERVSEQPAPEGTNLEKSSPKPSPQRVPSRRKSAKGIWRTADAMDFLAQSLSSRRQSDLASLQSQPVNAGKGRTPVASDSPRGVSITADRDEIAGTPEPEPSARRSESSESTDSSTEDDEPSLNPIDDELVFDQPHEAVMSASPRGSERINRVSHRPGRFFDTPSTAREKPASPRRSIFDRQANASRVVFSPGDSEESRSVERPREPAKRPAVQPPPAGQALSRKRGRGDSDDEASDDDFDQDTRSLNIAQRRAQVPEQARPAEKRQRLVHEDSSPAAGQLREDLAASQQQVEVAIPEARREAPSPLPTRRESRWFAENSVTSTSRQRSNIPSTIPQGRRKWTEEEDDRLIMLIAKHGTQWAAIQRQDQICPASDGGPQLTGRTQVNMKDRARTIKKKLVRSGLPLPLNFDRVTG